MSCRHQNCKCVEGDVESDGRTYCSARCEELEETGGHEERCSCGHAVCAAAAAAPVLR